MLGGGGNVAQGANANRVLVIEDDLFVQGLMSSLLETEGFVTARAGTAKQALAELERMSISAILLDLGLPDEEGLALLRKLRRRTTAPVIVVTSSDGIDERLAALEMGADDFVVKPVEPRELILRLKHAVRGSDQADSTRFEAAGWSLDLASRVLHNPEGSRVELRRAEFNLLAALFQARGRVLTRDQLLDAISTGAEAPTERTVDVLVSRVRKKTGTSGNGLIVTVTGVGYTLSASTP
jgi:DNA-binding response OmpR family regulator